jgi:hypothetical protein
VAFNLGSERNLTGFEASENRVARREIFCFQSQKTEATGIAVHLFFCLMTLPTRVREFYVTFGVTIQSLYRNGMRRFLIDLTLFETRGPAPESDTRSKSLSARFRE